MKRGLIFVKRTSNYRKLSSDDEISSIIYAVLCSVDKSVRMHGAIRYFNPIKFIVESLYNERFDVLKESSFITREGGARYVMNDVSSYRKAKGFEISDIAHLTELFSHYDCSSCNSIINFIYSVYVLRDFDSLNFDDDVINELKDTGEYDDNTLRMFLSFNEKYDDAVRRALMAYKVYYKNNISLSYLPDFKRTLADYMLVVNGGLNKDTSFTSSVSNFNGSSVGNKAVTFTHLKYPEVKMMIIADGTGSISEENVSYVFCDMMSEWFWQCDPYSSNFSRKLEIAMRSINNEIGSDNPESHNASVSVFVCTKDNFYISSVGTTRVYLIRGKQLEKIERVETLYDETSSKGSASAFDDFMREIPADYIGTGLSDSSKGDVQVECVPSYVADGVLMLTKSAYDNISDEILEYFVSHDESSMVLDDITRALPNSSVSAALYQKKAKTSLFSRKR